SGPARGMMRQILAEEGVDVEDGMNAQMIDQSEALAERVRQTPPQSNATALSALWLETEATIFLFDANAASLHASVEQPVWGNIS
ncbi:hypothetical protein ACEN9R_18890, partial [Curtobacterium sp. CT11-133]